MTAAQNCARKGCVPLLSPSNYAKSARTGREVGRDGMTDHGEAEYALAEGNDYAAHEQTYHNFITLVKVCLAHLVIILILMAYFLG
jgi:hypothetical protein